MSEEVQKTTVLPGKLVTFQGNPSIWSAKSKSYELYRIEEKRGITFRINIWNGTTHVLLSMGNDKYRWELVTDPIGDEE